MKVLVDTTIWSLALRRRRATPREKKQVDELSELVRELRAVMIGPVRQEVLSGISEPATFERVRQHLEPFDDLTIASSDYEEAARVCNLCRKKGVQGSQIDFLICSVAMRYGAAVFTTDRDFKRYAKHLDLELHQPR